MKTNEEFISYKKMYLFESFFALVWVIGLLWDVS